jgi:hypothetical protein
VNVHHEGACESRLTRPKLTNLLKSENTSLFPSPAFPPGLKTSPSPPTRFTRLSLGLAREVALRAEEGSMSRDDRNDVLSSSARVEVMVKKESNRSFCEAFAVPFKSRI